MFRGGFHTRHGQSERRPGGRAASRPGRPACVRWGAGGVSFHFPGSQEVPGSSNERRVTLASLPALGRCVFMPGSADGFAGCPFPTSDEGSAFHVFTGVPGRAGCRFRIRCVRGSWALEPGSVSHPRKLPSVLIPVGDGLSLRETGHSR